MKRIIDGKRYDTETAEMVAEDSNGYAYSDFNHCEETLYRTQRGNWFLYGEGGPMSKYSQAVGDMRGGGSAIVPLSADDARSWLENAGKTDELERYFPDSIEDA